jgi:hypothetical protein
MRRWPPEAARVMFDAGDVKTAKLQLAWVVEHGQDELRDLARLRLATLLLDEQGLRRGAEAARWGVSAGFARAFADTRGDVLGAQGKEGRGACGVSGGTGQTRRCGEQVRQGQEQRCRTSQANAAYRESLQLKLDALGEPG